MEDKGDGMQYPTDVRWEWRAKTMRMLFSEPSTISTTPSTARQLAAAGLQDKSCILSSDGYSSHISPEHRQEKECIESSSVDSGLKQSVLARQRKDLELGARDENILLTARHRGSVVP